MTKTDNKTPHDNFRAMRCGLHAPTVSSVDRKNRLSWLKGFDSGKIDQMSLADVEEALSRCRNIFTILNIDEDSNLRVWGRKQRYSPFSFGPRKARARARSVARALRAKNKEIKTSKKHKELLAAWLQKFENLDPKTALRAGTPVSQAPVSQIDGAKIPEKIDSSAQAIEYQNIPIARLVYLLKRSLGEAQKGCGVRTATVPGAIRIDNSALLRCLIKSGPFEITAFKLVSSSGVETPVNSQSGYAILESLFRSAIHGRMLPASGCRYRVDLTLPAKPPTH